jgi:hypothetical protein
MYSPKVIFTRIKKYFRATLRKQRFKGERFYCSICNYKFRDFLPFGSPKRANAMCPVCGSAERHRLLWSTLTELWKNGSFPTGGYLLHVAPEPMLAEKLKRLYSYLSVDMEEGVAMQAMDITNIPIDDDTYDTVICNHVLEHIPNDIKALKELFRVMKPGGWGSIQVPIKGDITDEDLSITDPEERTKRYGQSDHVRQYGKDFIDRLQLAGFTVSVIPKETLFDKDFLKQLSVEVEKDIILVRKPTITT